MKKIIVCVVMTIAMVFALCGCGGEPLANAYESLTAIAESTESTDGISNEAPLVVDYDEETDTLLLKIDNTVDIDPIFDAINEEIEGKDIGTIYFSLPGTAGDGFENKVAKKIGELSCSSMKTLGLDYYILNATSHNWLNLADKTEYLYINAPTNVFAYYGDKDTKRLKKFKEIQIAYTDTVEFAYFDRFAGAKTISLVTPLEVKVGKTSDDPLDNVLEGNDYLNSENATTETTTATGNSSDGEAAAAGPIEFSYYSASFNDPISLKKMKKLETLLIYPETGYTLSADGERLIKELQFIRPDLQINPPGEAFDGESLISITDIKTPNIPKDYADTILGELLESEVADLYTKCSKFKDKEEAPVLKGKCLIYKADPDQNEWSSKRKFSTVGEVLVTEPAKNGIKIPSTVNDYDTFVYVYPTYEKKGEYTSGTKAYAQTLNVKVFNIKDKTAYKAESVGTKNPPQSFSYYAGSVPDKHSGEVDVEEVYKYLKALKKQ